MSEARLWRHFMQPRSAIGLGVFRILYSLTLLGEVIQLCYLRQLVFDSAVSPLSELFRAGPVFALWFACIGCLVVGLGTRPAAVVNYLMTLATFSTFDEWEYHVDYVYTGVNFFLMFLPVSRALSIDAWLARRRADHRQVRIPSGMVPRVHYDALILVGIALVYFDSVFYKLASPMWTSGLGLWRPASLPHSTYWNVGWLLDIKPLMLALSYLTLAFEAVFIVAMWSDRLRPWLFAIGTGLHLGIVVMFPIPWFGFAVFALYVLLVPDRWWSAVFSRGTRMIQTNVPAANWTRSDVVASRLVATMTCLVLVSQLVMTSASDLCHQTAARVGGEPLRRTIEELAIRIHSPVRILFGVTRHPVFMDFHFDGYESFYTLVSVNADGTKTWLPMATETGQGRLGWSGRLWVNYTWRVSNPRPDKDMMRSGYERITAWWLCSRGRRLEDETFLVMERSCDPCNGWSPGYYQRQMAHDWKPIGVAMWDHGVFHFDVHPQGLVGTNKEASADLKRLK